MGMEEALANCGLSKDQLVIKRNVGEDAGCTTAIQECIDAGAQIIFCNSFGHEQFMIPLAEENPDIQFCHATGYQASQTENTNDHNYFTKIFRGPLPGGYCRRSEGQGINNQLLGYVGAFPFAEVVSGSSPPSIWAPRASIRGDHGGPVPNSGPTPLWRPRWPRL